jgi:hypothetical protein
MRHPGTSHGSPGRLKSPVEAEGLVCWEGDVSSVITHNLKMSYVNRTGNS